MRIFIDEAGNPAGVGGHNAIFVVGALIIPDSEWAKLQRAYLKIRPSLPKRKGEVKGNLLDEAQAAKVIGLLRRHEILFEAVTIDLGIHTEVVIESHRARQADGMTTMLSDAHDAKLAESVWISRREMESFPRQLYIQSAMIFELVRQVLEIAPAYYAQRKPKELSAFHWIVDKKDVNPQPTRWEQWWLKFIMPWMQASLLGRPLIRYRGFNYRHMVRFETEASDFFKSIAPPDLLAQGRPIDIKMILGENFRFSSEPEPGLELADMVTTVLRRALVGNIQQSGWRDLPRLIINRRGENLKVLAFPGAERPARRLAITEVVKAFRNSPRRMIATVGSVKPSTIRK